MIKKAKYLLGITLLGLHFCANAAFDLNIYEPYVGIEALATNQSYLYGYGNIIYPNNIREYGVFVGSKFIDYLGVEFGYEAQPKASKTSILRAGDTLTGDQIINPGTVYHMSSTIRLTHPYAGIFAEYKGKYKGVTRFRVQALLGISATHITASDAILADQNGPFNSQQYITNLNNYSGMQYCTMAKIVATLMVNNKIGVSGIVNYRNTRMLQPYALQGGLNQLKLYDTYGIGAGLVYYGFN